MKVRYTEKERKRLSFNFSYSKGNLDIAMQRKIS